MRFKLTSIFIILLSSQLFSQDYSISGQVHSSSIYAPLRNGSVKVKNIEPPFYPIDSLGYFHIDHLKAGEYRIKIGATYFIPIDTLIIIKSESIDNLNFTLNTNCHFNETTVKKDVENKELKIFRDIPQATISPKTKEMLKFEKKYKLKYVVGSGGDCIIDSRTDENMDCMVSYNRKVFEYLDERYGTKWRKKVIENVLK